MHLSDEQLLAHLDGELSFFREVRVRRHLKSCWRCRTRLGACEAQIHRLAVDMDEWRFPQPEWAADARHRLASRLQQIEAHRRPHRRVPIPVWAAAAAALLGTASWYFWTSGVRKPLRPADVIAHAAGVETTLYAQPVQQVFSVEIAQIRPSHKAVNAQLRVWSDRESGRFASRLSGPQGTLKHALWRPAADREFVYRAAGSHTVVEQRQHRAESISIVSLADRGLEPEQIEAAFLRWMESRSWNPISLTSDLSIWAAEDGTLASAEKLRAGDGTPVIRITARRETHTMVAVLSVDVESNSYRPRFESIRFETPERTVEFRLSATSIRAVRRADLSAAVFRPDPKLPSETVAVNPVIPRQKAPALPARGLERQLPVIDAREIQAIYVLHEAHACLGEPVRVSEEPGGVRVERIGSDGASFLTQAGLEFVLKALSDVRREPQGAPGKAGTLTLPLRHALALLHLANDFGARLPPGPSDPSLQLLATIVHDHTSAIRSELGALDNRPSRIAGTPFDAAAWRGSATVLLHDLSQLTNSDREGPGSHPAARIAAIGARLERLEAPFPSR